jgi:serine/threonine protein kinase
LGVVAFEALTGHVPYHAETPAAVMLAQMQSPLPAARSVNPSVPAAVESALARALAKEPADRFSDCGSFVKALESSSSAPAIAAATISAPAERPKPLPSARGPRARGNLWLLAGAAALVALLALAGVLYAASRGPSQTNQSGLAHGSLIYDASLTKTAWSSGGEPSPDPDGSASVAYGSGSIDIHILKDGAGLSGEFDGPSLKNYVSELVLRVDAGSDFEINWRIRGPGPNEHAEVGLNIQVAQEAMTLYLSPDVGSNQALTATLPVPGIQSGKTVELGMSVNGPNVGIFLGGKKVAQVSETTSTGATTPSFYMDGKSGALHIVSLRYYAVA